MTVSFDDVPKAPPVPVMPAVTVVGVPRRVYYGGELRYWVEGVIVALVLMATMAEVC